MQNEKFITLDEQKNQLKSDSLSNETEAKDDFKNQATLLSEPISTIKEGNKFITDDSQYIFDINNIKSIIVCRYYGDHLRLFNPYTRKLFTTHEYKVIAQKIDLNEMRKQLDTRQKQNKNKISQQTILKLKNLATGILNKDELTAQNGDLIETTQFSYQEFKKYYDAMKTLEKDALNQYYIKPFPTFYPTKNNKGEQPIGIGIKGIKQAITFEDFYESMDTYCSHTDGAILVKLVNQLCDKNDQWEYNDFIKNGMSEEDMAQLQCISYCCCSPCLLIVLLVQYVMIPTLSLIFMGAIEWCSALEDAIDSGYKSKVAWITLIGISASVGAYFLWNATNHINEFLYIGICIVSISFLMTVTSVLYELLSNQYKPCNQAEINYTSVVARIDYLNKEKQKLGVLGFTNLFTQKHRKKRELKKRIRCLNAAVKKEDPSNLNQLDEPYLRKAL